MSTTATERSTVARRIVGAVRGDWPTNRSRWGGTASGWVIVTILFALLAPAVMSAWILSSYFHVDIPASISMASEDASVGAAPGTEACDTEAVGIGEHCFSDFTSLTFASPFDEPTASEAASPMSTRILRLPFYLVQLAAGPLAALAFYLVVSLAALLVPAVWALRDVPWRYKGVILTALGFATAPGLAAWDRGNLVAIAVPFLLLALVGLARAKPWWVVIGVITASSVNPLFGLLGLALFAMRRWREGLVAVGGAVLVVAGSFALLGAGAIRGLGRWLAIVTGADDDQDLGSDSPVDLSAGRALWLLLHAGPWRSLPAVDGIPDDVYVLVGRIVLVLAVATIVLFGRHVRPVAVGAALLAAGVLAVEPSPGYLFVVVLVVAAVAFRLGALDDVADTPMRKALVVTFAAAVVTGVTPLVVPFRGLVPATEGMLVIGSLLPPVSVILWIVFLVLLSVSAVRSFRPARPEVLS